MWLTILAGIFSIVFGLARVREGMRILRTKNYIYREKTLLRRRRIISRVGESTRAYGISTLLSGIVWLCLLVGLIINKVYDPLTLRVVPMLAGLIEIPGFMISERNLPKESD